jgi:hypothetical protein
MSNEPMNAMMAGMRWRVLLSIAGPAAWLSFTLLYVGFWAKGYTIFQSVILVLVSLVILVAVLGSSWAYWGMHPDRWSRWERASPPSP